jgi:hypothetical protein
MDRRVSVKIYQALYRRYGVWMPIRLFSEPIRNYDAWHKSYAGHHPYGTLNVLSTFSIEPANNEGFIRTESFDVNCHLGRQTSQHFRWLKLFGTGSIL